MSELFNKRGILSEDIEMGLTPEDMKEVDNLIKPKDTKNGSTIIKNLMIAIADVITYFLHLN